MATAKKTSGAKKLTVRQAARLRGEPGNRSAPRKPYPPEWVPLVDAAGGVKSLADELKISHMTLNRIVLQGKPAGRGTVFAIRAFCLQRELKSPV